MIPTNVMSFMKKMVTSENTTTNASSESGACNAQDLAGSSGAGSSQSSTFGKIRQTLSSSLLTAAHEKVNVPKMLADAELDRTLQLFDHLEQSYYPDLFDVCFQRSVSNYKSSNPNTIYLLLCLKVKLLKSNRLNGPIAEDIFQYYLWQADEISTRLRLSFAAILNDLFALKSYDFAYYRSICPPILEPKHYEIFKYLLAIRENSFGDVPLDDWEQEIWERAVLERNHDLILLSYDINRFRSMNVECIESMLLHLLPSTQPLVAKKANYLFKKLIEAGGGGGGGILDTNLMDLCLLNESLDERQSHLINANLRLLPKLKNLHLKWNVCLIKKFMNLELSSILVLVEVFKYFGENFNQADLTELFREGNLFNVLNMNPQLFQKPELIDVLNRIVQELNFDSTFSFNNYEKTFLNSISLVQNWNPICFLALFLLFFQYKCISKFHYRMINMIADISVVTVRDFCYQYLIDNSNFCYTDIVNEKTIAQLCFRSLMKQSKNLTYTLEYLKYQTKRFDTIVSLKIFANLLELIEAEYPDRDLRAYMLDINLPPLFFDYVDSITENRLGDLCPHYQNDYFPYCLKVFVLFFKDYLIETKTFYKFETILQSESIDECNSERIDRYQMLLDKNDFDGVELVNNPLFLSVYFQNFLKYDVDQLPSHIDYLIRTMLHSNETKLERRIETVLQLMHNYHSKNAYAVLYPLKLKCLNHFLRVVDKNFKSNCFIVIAVRYFERESAPNKYYENSTVHRNLLRLMQLLFVYFITITQRDKIYQFCFRELQKNKHFDSITYYMYAIISHYPYADLPDAILHDPKHFLMLAYFALRLDPQSFKDYYFIQTTKMIAYPKFAIRSLAISLLATYFKTLKAPEASEPEYLIRQMVLKAVRDYAIEVVPFFECLDKSQLYTLENIFYHVPRLFGMHKIDCLPLELLLFEPSNRTKLIPVQKPNKFAELEPKVVKNGGMRSDESLFDRQLVTFDSTSLVQRKPEIRLAKRFDESANNKLIVVASLIDTSANLGGLCRTCQIFGAGQLVLANKNVIGQNQVFRSLSMTAENWIDVCEVRIDRVCDYLRAKKTEGFRIVGVEQTSNSRQLNKFEFEPCTVLVLGNEKHGILPTVLNVLDDCVEIPQVGIIPSLNVHVAASICIWEYFKQFA